jgi:amidase
LFDLLETLDQMPVEHPVLKGVTRDPGIRPSPQDDPYNAILRRCSVKGSGSGKLAGVRVGLKDNISVAGLPMTCGSRVLSGYVPEIDATIVARLLEEGAEIVAILNMEDFAWSGVGDSSAYGPVFNPHSKEHLASGSSSGSAAALYYDDIDMTLGCDQGGSIRMPAAWCGVVGLKPTFGLVPYTGIVGGELGFDHVGPMTRSAEQAALMLEVIAGKDPLDPRQGEVPVEGYTQALDGNVKGLRVGVVKEGFGLRHSEAEVDAAVHRSIAELAKIGMETREISVPVHSTAMSIYRGAMTEGGAALMRARGLGYGWQGYYDVGLGETLGKALRAQANDLPPELKVPMVIGTYLSEYYHGRLYAKAQNLRPALRASYDSALEEFDLLAMPTMPMRAMRYKPDIDWKTRVARGIGLADNCSPFDATGHPAISIPCGKPDGLPVGLMLIARHFQDALLLKAAHAFEHQVDWEKL